MAFQKLTRPRRSTATTTPAITIGSTQNGRQTYLSINTAARRALGDPAAVTLEWDPDAYILRLVAAASDEADSYRITDKSGRISVTGVMRDLGIDCTRTTPMQAKPSGRCAITADLSGMPAAKILPLRRTA